MNCNKNIERQFLYDKAQYVRSKVEECKKDNPDLFYSFPYGFCATASIWLYDFLSSLGIQNIEFLSRDPFLNFKGCGNHMWIRTHNFNIDITADQYNEDGFFFQTVSVNNDNELYYSYDCKSTREEVFYSEYIGKIACGFTEIPKRWNAVYLKLFGRNFSD